MDYGVDGGLKWDSCYYDRFCGIIYFFFCY